MFNNDLSVVEEASQYCLKIIAEICGRKSIIPTLDKIL